MGSRALLLASAIVAGVLSVTAVIGSIVQVWWLVTAAVTALLSLVLVVAMDADRRIRDLRRYLMRDFVRSQPAPVIAEQDVIGTVRLLQAQYTGRLDRLHAAVENALDELERSRGDATDRDEHVAN